MKALVKGRLLLSSPQWLGETKSYQVINIRCHRLTFVFNPYEQNAVWRACFGHQGCLEQRGQLGKLKPRSCFSYQAEFEARQIHKANTTWIARATSLQCSRGCWKLWICAVNKGNDKHWTYSVCQCPTMFWNDQSHLTARPARASMIAGWIAPGTNSLQSKHAMLFPSHKQKAAMTELPCRGTSKTRKWKSFQIELNSLNPEGSSESPRALRGRRESRLAVLKALQLSPCSKGFGHTTKAVEKAKAKAGRKRGCRMAVNPGVSDMEICEKWDWVALKRLGWLNTARTQIRNKWLFCIEFATVLAGAVSLLCEKCWQ